MKKVKQILKMLFFCKHKYQAMGFTSYTKNREPFEGYDTKFIFQCSKCGRWKYFKTYGKDFITLGKRKV